MKIYEVFNKVQEELKNDSRVMGIFLTGSLARGTETKYSDLDVIVLSCINCVDEKVVEGVPVEVHFNTLESIKERFRVDAPSLYLYKYGKVIYDPSNIFEGLIQEANCLLENYVVSEERKAYLKHKIGALKEKLTASLNLKDHQKINYLMHNNFKVIVESIFALNSLPLPPQGLTYEIFNTLSKKPSDTWLTDIINLKGIEQGEYALEIIDFIEKA